MNKDEIKKVVEEVMEDVFKKREDLISKTKHNENVAKRYIDDFTRPKNYTDSWNLIYNFIHENNDFLSEQDRKIIKSHLANALYWYSGKGRQEEYDTTFIGKWKLRFKAFWTWVSTGR